MKISAKLEKVDENIIINRYDNGFMVEVSGQDYNENWASAKIVVSSIDEVNALINEWSTLPSR